MKKGGTWGTIAATLACLVMLTPPAARADEPAPPLATSEAQDVALGNGGLLVGQVLNGQGLAQAGATVSVRQGDYEVVRTTTDENGLFAAQGLRGGQYAIKSDDSYRVCRLWAPNTAPPGAEQHAVIVQSNEVVRGQWGYHGGFGRGGHPWLHWMKAHPYLTAGTIAAAIAVPIAFADDDDGPSS
jgi:hypothetical protein